MSRVLARDMLQKMLMATANNGPDGATVVDDIKGSHGANRRMFSFDLNDGLEAARADKLGCGERERGGERRVYSSSNISS